MISDIARDNIPAPMTDWLTPARCRIILVLTLALGLCAHFIYLMDSPIDLVGDEAHYWDWSRQLGLSYYSKGPAVAYVIALGTWLLGDTVLGVRFPALLFAVGTSICTYWLTLRIFRSERLALGAVLMCHLVPMFILGSLLMTIDPPYYFGWALATCLAHVAIVDGRRWAWLAAGLVIGLAFLAKYAALIWLACVLLYLLIDGRRWLRTPWPWLMILAALACTAPVIAWNLRHDWVTFGHVSQSTTENQSGFNPIEIARNIGVMLGSQIGIVNPIIFAFMVAGVVVALKLIRRAPSPGVPGEGVSPSRSDLIFLLSFALPFFAICLGVSILKEIQPNWPAPTYFTLVPLAAWYIARYWPRTKGWLIGAVVIGLVAMPLLHFTHLLYPVLPIKPRQLAAHRFHGASDVGQEVSVLLRRADLTDPFILADKYFTASLLAFYVDGHPKTYYAGSYFSDFKRRDRLSQFDMWPDRSLDQPDLIGRDAIYVGKLDAPAAADFARAFDRVSGPIKVPITRRGVWIDDETIHLCYNFHGMQRPADGKVKR